MSMLAFVFFNFAAWEHFAKHFKLEKKQLALNNSSNKINKILFCSLV